MSELTFFQKQFLETGLSKNDNVISVYRLDDDTQKTEMHIYSEARKNNENEEADLKITYPDLYGGVYTYETDSKNTPTKWYSRIRYRQPKKDEEGREKKYHSPSGSGMFPFFNKLIIETYQLAVKEIEAGKELTAKIKILVITEGEKKASRLCAFGVHAVGIGGITNWRAAKGLERLHPDLEELIIKTRVETLMFLKDADAASIIYKAKTDLSQRPQMFYSNIMQFGEATSFMVDSERHSVKKIVYAHLDPTNQKTAKGIDDLLNLEAVKELTDKEIKKLDKLEQEQYKKAWKRYKERCDKIRQDFEDLAPIGSYLRCFDLGHPQGVKQLLKAFGLENPKNFYQTYGAEIGNRHFEFKRKEYQYIDGEVHFVKHKDLDFYVFVHDTLYKKVRKVDVNNNKTTTWKQISQSYVKSIVYKDYKNFLFEVPRYDSFCVLPDNTENFKQVVDNNFNLYSPLPHLPKKGDWKHTYKFLKQLFRGKGTIEFDKDGNWIENFEEGCPFSMMIDWLTILIQKPLMKLPVPCLYSEANGTGKSTLMHLVEAILGENGTVLSNEEFLSPFNSHFIYKLFVGLDEAMIEKNVEKERLKQMVTAKHGHLQNKGKDREKLDFFAKFIFCTNKADFMAINENETRWFVMEVVPFDKSEQVADILTDFMLPEIPAFLHYLRTRTIFHPKVSRTWFKEELYQTEAFKKVVKKTKPKAENIIEDFIVKKFLDFGLTTLKMDLEHITEGVNAAKGGTGKVDRIYVKNYLKDKYNVAPSIKNEYYKMPISFSEGDSNYPKVETVNKTGKPLTFHYYDWLEGEQLTEFLTEDPIRDAALKNSGIKRVIDAEPEKEKDKKPKKDKPKDETPVQPEAEPKTAKTEESDEIFTLVNNPNEPTTF